MFDYQIQATPRRFRKLIVHKTKIFFSIFPFSKIRYFLNKLIRRKEMKNTNCFIICVFNVQILDSIQPYLVNRWIIVKNTKCSAFWHPNAIYKENRRLCQWNIENNLCPQPWTGLNGDAPLP